MTTARGRYIVGLQPGGTLGGVAGTAFSIDLENRPVGQHSHGPSQIWGFNDTADSGAIRRPLFDFKPVDVGTADVAITDAAGAVAGTNAPYIQLLVCQKN